MDEQGLNEIGAKFVSQIQQAFDDNNLNDTGKAKDSLSFRVEAGQRIIIEGLARTMFLQFGRKPGTPPPFHVIKAWVERKLNVPEEAVWIVTKTIVDKIAREGTNIFTDKSKGLELEIILSDLNEELAKMVIDYQAMQFTNGLITTWEK